MDRRQLADDVKTRVSVVEVVGRYVQLSKKGNNHTGLCPFHSENTPSFIVSEDKGIYKCFGCGEGGDAIAFLSKMESISYGEATVRLAETANIDPKVLGIIRRNNERNNFDQEFTVLKFVQGFYQYYLLHAEEGKLALEYLNSRGITKTIIEHFGIGLAPKDGQLLIKALEQNSHSLEVAKRAGIIGQNDNGDYYSQFRGRIMFTVKNEQGNVLGFSGRTYLPDDNEQAKYVNSPESRVFQKSQIVYNLHEARKMARTSGRLLLFEGFLDVIAAHNAGFHASVATMGTAFTLNHAKTISRHAKEVVLVFDGDKAGMAATAKAIPILFAAGLQVKVTLIPNGMDPDDYVKKNGPKKFVETVDGAIGALDFIYEYAKQGLNLETTDGEALYERRLEELGKQYGVGTNLLWKFRNSKKQRSSNGNNYQNKQTVAGEKLPSIPGEVKAEKELIYYMMLDRQVFNLVLAQIGTAFNIDTHRKIAQAIEAHYVQHGKLELGAFLRELDDNLMKVTHDLVMELKKLPKNWSPKMIKDLTNRVEQGAVNLARAGLKEMFYQASYEQQLSMMKDLTAVQLTTNSVLKSHY